MYLGSEGVKS